MIKQVSKRDRLKVMVREGVTVQYAMRTLDWTMRDLADGLGLCGLFQCVYVAEFEDDTNATILASSSYVASVCAATLGTVVSVTRK